MNFNLQQRVREANPPSATRVASNRREKPREIIGRNLVIARDLAGMTQHDLAARSGVSRATIAQLESGAGDPRLSTIADVAEALGVSPVVLLAGHREVFALAGVAQQLTLQPVSMNEQDAARMRALAESDVDRDWRKAARIGAAVSRAAGCQSPGATTTAGLFSTVVPGRGTSVGAALGHLLG